MVSSHFSYHSPLHLISLIARTSIIENTGPVEKKLVLFPCRPRTYSALTDRHLPRLVGPQRSAQGSIET